MTKRIDLRAEYEGNIRSWDWEAIKIEAKENEA